MSFREEINTSKGSFIYVMICLVLFTVFLVVMIILAYYTNVFENITYHQCSVQTFHKIDALMNSALFILTNELKESNPDASIS